MVMGSDFPHLLGSLDKAVSSIKNSRPALERILVVRGIAGPRIHEVIEPSRAADVPVRFEDRAGLDHLASAWLARTLVLLDGVEDPHDLGAVVRTAHTAGADAVIIPNRRASGLTETATARSRRQIAPGDRAAGAK